MAIRVGLLGLAHGHVSAYCEEWKKNPEYGVVAAAGWDHDAERLKKAAESFGIDTHDDIDALLKRDDIQAVIVGAETSMHADMVEKAAAAGKAIVLQKPLSVSLADADRIVAAVERHGVPFTMAWQMRVDPQNVKMKELLQSGEFGKVFTVRRRHGLGAAFWPGFADSWHVNREYNRDIWADDSSHPIDFLHWLLGVPETVTAEVESLFDPKIPNDNGVAVFRYAGGPIAEVNCSFTCHASESTTEIICEKGTIVQYFGDGTSANIPRQEGLPGLKWFIPGTGWVTSDIESPPNHSFRIRGLAQPIAEFLQGKRGPMCTAEEGRTSLKMVLATYVSSREGRRITLDDPAIAGV